MTLVAEGAEEARRPQAQGADVERVETILSAKGLLLITEHLSVRYDAFRNLKLNNTLIVCSHLYTIQGTQEFHTTIVPGILDKSCILIIHQGDALPPVQSGSVHPRLQTAFHATRKIVIRSATSSFSPESTMSPMTSLTFTRLDNFKLETHIEASISGRKQDLSDPKYIYTIQDAIMRCLRCQ